MRLKCVGLTDSGMVRDHNEDGFLIALDEALVIVADGMGGHLSGEVASRMALDEISAYYGQTHQQTEVIALEPWPFGQKKPRSREERRLIASMRQANHVVYQAAKENEMYKGMGTTIVGAYFVKKAVVIAHVGDSRCYCFRDGVLSQITEDHSLASEYVRAKLIKADQVSSFMHRNVITRAIGLQDVVHVETSTFKHRDGDIYLLCSDGLTDPLNVQEITEILTKHCDDLGQACRDLVIAANTNGGPDNITVLLAKISY